MTRLFRGKFRQQIAPWLVLLIWLNFPLLYYAVTHDVLILAYASFAVLLVANLLFALYN